MSKTSEKNLKTTVSSLRRFEEWVTSLRRKYRKSLFFSTQWNIVAFHTFFVIVIVFVFIGLLQYTNKTLLSAVISSFEDALTSGVFDRTVLTDAVGDLRTIYFIVLGGIIVLGGLAGYFAARITLRPTKRALEIQKRFVADIAHELRTPLATLRTTNEIALLDTKVSSAGKDIINSNLDEIKRMSTILDNLLSLSRVDTHESLVFSEVDMKKVIEKALNTLQPYAKRKKIGIDQELFEIPSVWGNETSLGQVVHNLIKNALTYTHDGGSIHIRAAKSEEGGVIFSVSDTGIGIAEKDLPHVFEPFYRTDPARTHTESGSGLGLAIVFEIIKLHEGKLAIKSQEGIGTTVTVTLPSKTTLIQKEDGPDTSFDFSKNLS